MPAELDRLWSTRSPHSVPPPKGATQQRSIPRLLDARKLKSFGDGRHRLGLGHSRRRNAGRVCLLCGILAAPRHSKSHLCQTEMTLADVINAVSEMADRRGAQVAAARIPDRSRRDALRAAPELGPSLGEDEFLIAAIGHAVRVAPIIHVRYEAGRTRDETKR